jgi:hypothetical protein
MSRLRFLEKEPVDPQYWTKFEVLYPKRH